MVEPYIQTYTRKAFYVLDPKVEDVDIQDIAHALSNLCRWSGHCKKFYSVAEHSINVSLWTPSEDDAILSSLLHDATEAYLNDLARPIKHDDRMKFYRDAEAKLACVINEKFGVNIGQPLVKKADNLMLNVEALQLLQKGPFWKKQIPEDTPKVKLHCWSPTKAKKEFLKRFEELTNGK